jgi:predicted ATP-dependent endonuclease of OLD family
MKKIYGLIIEKLKGLQNETITFSDTLTAIMGVNGAGKTTILHALACVYNQEEKGEEYKFPNFFVPSRDNLWDGSKFTAVYSENDEKNELIYKHKTYAKSSDRWTPPYKSRPKRDVFYLGIATCMPEIELRKYSGYVYFKNIEEKTDRISDKIIQKAASILNIDYDVLKEIGVWTNDFKFLSVKRKNGLEYSALSMGTGEQRIIKILSTVLSAPHDSLILIDEIDLLLHINALKNLLSELNDIAQDRKLQIIFTTHSLLMTELDFVKIRYVKNTPNKTFVFENISTDLIYDLTGESKRPIKIYVEDLFAESIVRKIARELDMIRKIEFIKFGSIENSFTLASSKILDNEQINNTLIIIDGDKHATDKEKQKRIGKFLSGDEKDSNDKRSNALKLIKQFALPDDCKHPEKYIHSLLLKIDREDEIINIAKEIHRTNDKHKYIDEIVNRIGDKYDTIVSEILNLVSKEVEGEWLNYTKDIREWLQERKNV